MSSPRCVSLARLKAELGGVAMKEFLLAFVPEDVTDEDEINAAIDNELSEIILDAQSDVESETRVLLFHSKIVPAPDSELGLMASLPDGANRFDTTYDLDLADWRGTGTIRLHFRPVLCVEEVSIRFAGGASTSPVRTFGPGSINIKHGMGIINLSLFLGLSAQSPRAMPMPHWGRMGAWPLSPMGGRHQPGALAVSYVAGLLPREFNPETNDDPSMLCPHFPVRTCIDLVKMKAALMCLRKLQDAVGAGGGSIAMDGLSQTYDPNRFSGRMQGYETRIQAKVREVERAFGGGVRMFSK